MFDDDEQGRSARQELLALLAILASGYAVMLAGCWVASLLA